METTGLIRAAARWIARGVGGLMVVLLLVFFIGEGLAGALPRLTLAESLEIAACGLMAAGAVLGWWRERAGGILCIAGGAAFIIVESVSHGVLDLVWFPLVFAGAGALFVISGVLGQASAGTPQRRAS